MGLLDEPAGGIPTVSWLAADRGDSVKGVILPQWEKGEETFFTERQQTNMDSGEKKTFSDGNPMMQYHIHLMRDVPAVPFSDCSKPAKARAREEELTDDGVRQIVIKGYSEKGLRKALQDFRRRTKRFPAPGDQIKITLTDDAYGPSAKGKLFTVAFAEATEATAAAAEAYRQDHRPAPPKPVAGGSLISADDDFDDDGDAPF